MYISKTEARKKTFEITSLINQIEIDLHYTGKQRISPFGFTGFGVTTSQRETLDQKFDFIIKELKKLHDKSQHTRSRVSEECSQSESYAITLAEKIKELSDELSVFDKFEVFYLKEKADKKLNLTHTFYRCRACKARVEKTERLLHAEQVHYTNVFYTIKTHRGVTTK